MVNSLILCSQLVFICGSIQVSLLMCDCVLTLPFIFTNTTHGNDTGGPENAPSGHKDEIHNTHQVDPLGSNEEVGSCINDGNGNLDLFPFAEENDVENNECKNTNSCDRKTWILFPLLCHLQHSSHIVC